MPSTRPDSPESVLDHALGLIDAMDYAGVVALCDRDSMAACLDEFRARMRPPTEREVGDRFPHLTTDEKPRWFAAILKDHQRKLEQIPRTLGDGVTYAQLLELAPDEFFRRMLEGEDVRGSAARQLRERGITPPPILTAPVLGVRYEVFPAVPMGASEARVSYRRVVDREGASDQELEHEDLRRGTDGSWRLVARRELLQPRGSTANVIELPPEIVALLQNEV